MKSKMGIGIGISVLAIVLIFGFSMSLYHNASAAKRSELNSIGKLSDTERITRANVKFQGLVDKPQEVSTALISFEQLEDKDFIKNLIADKNLTVKQVYFAIPVSKGPTTRGGFIPKNDLEIVFDDHKNELIASFQVSVESMRRTVGDKPQFEVETEKDSEFIKTYEIAEKALRLYEERLTKVQQNGVAYNGLQVEASNNIVMELVSKPGIRAVEIVTSKFDQKASPMLPEGVSSFTK
jgi:hypothetical protein